jgi:predicted oxidoreductase (fatty acid repression mutant protein)
MASKAFLDTMLGRRTIYALQKASPVSNGRIQEIVKHTLLHTPSSFNSQSTRIVILFGAEHEAHWAATDKILRAMHPDKPEAEYAATTGNKMNGFKGAYATVSGRLPESLRDSLAEHCRGRWSIWRGGG